MSQRNGNKGFRRGDAGPLMKAAMRAPLLTREEETALGKCAIQYRESQERGVIDPVSKKGWERAINTFVQHNLRLVMKIALRFEHRGLELEDLMQEGAIGLRRAADKFDYRMGFKFSTYATWWVRQAMQRAVGDQGRDVRLPVNQTDATVNILRAEDYLRSKLKKEPAQAEVAYFLGITEKKLEQVKIHSFLPSSLYGAVGNEGDLTLQDVLPDSRMPQDVQCEEAEVLLRLKRAIERITSKKTRSVLLARFGVMGEEVGTLADIGKILELSRERIRQIESIGLRQLRNDKQLRRELGVD